MGRICQVIKSMQQIKDKNDKVGRICPATISYYATVSNQQLHQNSICQWLLLLLSKIPLELLSVHWMVCFNNIQSPFITWSVTPCHARYKPHLNNRKMVLHTTEIIYNTCHIANLKSLATHAMH